MDGRWLFYVCEDIMRHQKALIRRGPVTSFEWIYGHIERVITKRI